jgi:molybdopterin-containing oxidoreductase family iron-sulfur binding subunit
MIANITKTIDANQQENTELTTTSTRREFLKTSSVSAAGLTVLGSGISLKTFANSTPVTNAKRWGMLIDTKALDSSSIDNMVNACKSENGWGGEAKSNDAQQAQWIKNITVKDRATGKVDNLPLMCQHCEEPPCVDVCPTSASMKREDGIVLVDKHRCIGCRFCMMACPYGSRSFAHEDITGQKEHMPRGKGTVESCTMCVHRIDKGGVPACVEASNGAIVFGDLNDENSAISKKLASVQSTQIRADLQLNTGVRYSGI